MRAIEEEYSDIRYDLLSLMTGDHSILPHRPAWGLEEGVSGYGGQKMVYTAADVKRDKKYAREKLIGRMIRYTVPGYGTRDGRIVRYGSVGVVVVGGWVVVGLLC